MALRIPRTIHLPFGYTVKVRQVTRPEMRDAVDDDEELPDGCWSVDDRTIYLLRSLSAARKRYLLAHELVHAAHDAAHQQLNDGTGRP